MPHAKILLFYRFAPLADPEAVRLWQRDLCESLGLRGRILLSTQGINGTVGGDLAAMKRYARKLKEYAPFRGIDLKWSEGTGLDADGRSLDFPRLSVKVRDEIVTFGAPGELRVDADGVIGGGTHLTPGALHDLVARRGDDVVFFDGRNAFEAEIGRFRGAIVPDVTTTRDFVAELDSGRYDHLKGKPVVTYCTGGIRCEVLSSLMVARGFGEVYQLDGGIVRYGESFGNTGLWDGSLYVFDGRGSVSFGERPAVIGACAACGAPESRMVNCADDACKVRVVQCAACSETDAARCASHAVVAARWASSSTPPTRRTMTTQNLARYVDHTLLKPEATSADVAATIAEAAELGTYSVCLSPSVIPVEVPEGLKLAVVVGFPSGKHHSSIKAAEARLAASQGVDEIDMVIDVGAAIEGLYDAVEGDIRAVRDAAPRPVVLKVIIESAALSDDAIVAVCQAAERAGADFVKTSTGFHPTGGATVHAVRLMKQTVGDRLEVKASGGIRTREDAEAMIAAGATRLGLSSTRAILADETAAAGY